MIFSPGYGTERPQKVSQGPSSVSVKYCDFLQDRPDAQANQSDATRALHAVVVRPVPPGLIYVVQSSRPRQMLSAALSV